MLYLNVFSKCLFMLLFFLSATVMGGETTRVSVNSSGKQGNGESGGISSGGVGISASGRYVVFGSEASNLVANDTNNISDVFVYDRLTKQTNRVSVNSSGTQGNAPSYSKAISADGRFIVFSSASTNLVSGDTNNKSDAFVHDRETKKTSRVSVSSSGIQGNKQSFSTDISADGRFVLFYSDANNLVGGDNNNAGDAFVHDRLTRQTKRVSISSSGVQGNADIYPSSISADGRFVAYYSLASNLVVGDSNIDFDVFVHERQTGKTALVSLATSGNKGNRGSSGGRLSADGRFVVYTSRADNLITGDTNLTDDVFVHDRQNKETTRVSIGSNGQQIGRPVEYPEISADGRFVVFTLWDTGIEQSCHCGGAQEIFIHDRKTKRTEKVSIGLNGQIENPYSFISDVSADGRFVVFNSTSDNLVAGDTNGIGDVFVRDRIIDNSHVADLKATVTKKPLALTANSTGTYQFTVTNLGPQAATDVRLTHTVSNGPPVSKLTPSQGACNRYATIGLCRFGQLLPGKSLIINVDAAALQNPLIQRLAVTGAPKDISPSNNYLDISTTISP